MAATSSAVIRPLAKKADEYWAAFTAYDVPDEQLDTLFQLVQEGDTDLSENYAGGGILSEALKT